MKKKNVPKEERETILRFDEADDIDCLDLYR